MNIQTPNLLRNVSAVGMAVLLTGFSLSANARLKDTPPKDLAFNGSWQIDVDQSDDPTAVLVDTRELSGQNAQRGGGGMHGGRHGGGSSGGMGGHGSRGRQPSSTNGDDDSNGSSSNGKRRGAQQSFLNDIAQNPTKLNVSAKKHSLNIAWDVGSSNCEAGEKFSIVDSNGTSERQCGWDGRAWVVETAYKQGVTRSDRFEFSKDGKQLKYITKVSGGRTATIKLARVYTYLNGDVPAPVSQAK